MTMNSEDLISIIIPSYNHEDYVEHAIRSANAKKDKSLMIGDDLDVDVLGAINFGIDAVYYSQNTLYDSEDAKCELYSKNKVNQISSLLELLELL